MGVLIGRLEVVVPLGGSELPRSSQMHRALSVEPRQKRSFYLKGDINSTTICASTWYYSRQWRCCEEQSGVEFIF